MSLKDMTNNPPEITGTASTFRSEEFYFAIAYVSNGTK